MRTRAGDRDDMMEDTDSSTNPTGETTATNHRRDAETRSFGKSDHALDDRARDATAETLVDIMKLTRGGTSPKAARARANANAMTTTTTTITVRDTVRAVNNTYRTSVFWVYTGRRARRVCVGTSCINGANDGVERNAIERAVVVANDVVSTRCRRRR